MTSLRLKRWVFQFWSRLPGFVKSGILWLTLPKYLVGAMAVVFDEWGRVLLFRHTYRKAYPWGLPGGWLKRREEAADAVEREVFEESGYRIQALHALVIGGDPDQRRLDLIYLCECVGGEFQPSGEVEDAQFFPLDALPGQVEPFHVHVVRYAAVVRRPRSPRASELEATRRSS